ncbi:MAG: hypothetical protein QOH96_1505 [Blastocatellia bacterium]|nr:hypothetical protein [Blastocatellia bacterium]
MRGADLLTGRALINIRNRYPERKVGGVEAPFKIRGPCPKREDRNCSQAQGCARISV